MQFCAITKIKQKLNEIRRVGVHDQKLLIIWYIWQGDEKKIDIFLNNFVLHYTQAIRLCVYALIELRQRLTHSDMVFLGLLFLALLANSSMPNIISPRVIDFFSVEFFTKN